MAQRFVACDREQSFLMAPDVREWLPANHLAWRASLAGHVQPADSEGSAAGLNRIRGGWSAYRGGPLAAHAGRCGYGGATRLDCERGLAWHPDCGRDRWLTLQVESPRAHEGGTSGAGEPGWRAVGPGPRFLTCDPESRRIPTSNPQTIHSRAGLCSPHATKTSQTTQGPASARRTGYLHVPYSYRPGCPHGGRSNSVDL